MSAITTLFNGSREDLFLFCSKENDFYTAYYTDFKKGQFHGVACKYKKLLTVVKFAKKYHFKLDYYKRWNL